MVFIYFNPLYEVYMHWRSELRERKAPTCVWLNRRWHKVMSNAAGRLHGMAGVIRRGPMPGIGQGTCQCATPGSTAVARTGDEGRRGFLARGWS